MAPVYPGTYRIISEGSNTAMTLPDWNGWDVVCWHQHDGKNQKWFVQRSGEAFRIKNCHVGHYLAVSRVNDVQPVYCGRYPTTWVLNQVHEGIYTIKCGDDDRIIDLDGWGKGHDGNHMHLYRNGEHMVHRRWRFERLGDDTGEEEEGLRQEIASKNCQLGNKDRQLGEKDQQLADQNKQLVDRNKQLADQGRQLAQIAGRLSNQDKELARVKSDLAEKSALLTETQAALRHANEQLASRDAALSRIEEQKKSDRLENDLAQQKEKTANLQEKMESFERLFSQMTNQDVRRPNNMA